MFVCVCMYQEYLFEEPMDHFASFTLKLMISRLMVYKNIQLQYFSIWSCRVLILYMYIGKSRPDASYVLMYMYCIYPSPPFQP